MIHGRTTDNGWQRHNAVTADTVKQSQKRGKAGNVVSNLYRCAKWDSGFKFSFYNIVKTICPAGFEGPPGVSSCYAFFLRRAQREIRDTAKSLCQYMDIRAHLVTVQTAAEMAYLDIVGTEILPGSS